MLIVITGNYGKSFLAYYLANELARNEKRAILVSTEQNAPSFQFLLPALKEDTLKSLGRILAGAVIDGPAVLQNTISNIANKDMAIVSYAPGETANTYPAIVRRSLEDLLAALNGIVDYVVVETQTQQNDIDRFFLEHCDLRLCITSADLKGLSWRRSHPEIEEKAVNLLCSMGKGRPTEDIARTFQTPLKYILPSCGALAELYDGRLITETPVPVKYAAVLKRLQQDTGLLERPVSKLKALFQGKGKRANEQE